MKTIKNISLGILLFCMNPILAVEPQTVYPITKQKMELSWYQNQSVAWVKQLEKDPSNKVAWLNYYTAKRMEKIMGGDVTQKDLDALVNDLQQAIPNTFEAYYVRYYNSNNEFSSIELLQKAYELDPERYETYDKLMTYYEIIGEESSFIEMANKLFMCNAISPSIYTWNYNMLMSVEEDGILFTNGDNDTYPSWVLQYVKGIRPDITVINTSLITLDEYRSQKLNELGIAKMNKNFSEFSDRLSFYSELFRYIKEQTDKPIYLAASINKDLYTLLKKDLYNVGLAFKWTDSKFDNIAVMKRNYERRFLTDYMKIELSNDLSASVSHQMDASYLMPFITLHNHYLEGEEKMNLQQMENLIESIAGKSGMEEEVKQILNPSSFSNVVSKTIDDPRDALWGMLEINDTLWCSQREIENTMYNKFLMDLLKQRRYDDLEIAKMEDVDWMGLLDERYKSLSYDKIFEHGKPDDDAFPVINISYEAAVLYCKWLTNIYNNLEHKKKKFKKVEFRLPTEKEWEFLAKSGNEQIVNYPWGNHKSKEQPERDYDLCVTNLMGCMLANIDGYSVPKEVSANAKCPASSEEPTASIDGGIFPVKTATYSPNDFGLYNITGNVAEMVYEKGIAKGGSWKSSMEEAKIGARLSFNAPSPEVGFRVIMVVKEK